MNVLDIIFYEFCLRELKKILFISVSVIRIGLNGSLFGGVDYCSLCFIDLWINLLIECYMDNLMNIFIRFFLRWNWFYF